MISKKHIPAINKEGYSFIIIGIVAVFLLVNIFPAIAWFASLITIFIICFFRDPERSVPHQAGLIVSPADGLVSKIEDAYAPEELGLPKKLYKRVSIFLSVFNVHVNRVPVAGKITALHYRAGKFLNASLDKASVDNERQSCVVQTKSGEKIIFVQIAGLIAKRIICDLEEGQEVATGERFGIIRFGSRVDLYLPQQTKIEVREGQTMLGGETVIAALSQATKAPAKLAKTQAKTVKVKAKVNTPKAKPKKSINKAKATPKKGNKKS